MDGEGLRVFDAFGLPEDGQDPPRRPLVRAVLPLVVLAAGIAVAMIFGESGEPAQVPPAPRTSPTATATARPSQAPTAGSWSRMDLGRLAPRRAVTTAWTGRELFVWGGYDASDPGLDHRDGVMLDPRTERLRPIPDAPFPASGGATAIWTGSEVLAWTVESGAGLSYRPDRERWATVPGAPWHPFLPHLAWTGDVVLAWQPAWDEPISEGSTYDPARRRWDPIPAAPMELDRTTAVWTGEELVVLGRVVDEKERIGGPSAAAVAYDPARGGWRVLPEPPVFSSASAISIVGGRLVAWDYGRNAATMAPDGDGWTQAPDVPFPSSECYPAAIRLRRAVLDDHCGELAVFDGRRWSVVGTPAELTSDDLRTGVGMTLTQARTNGAGAGDLAVFLTATGSYEAWILDPTTER